MKKKKKESEPQKVLITFEVIEQHTRCCECIFGGECSYEELIEMGLDCDKYDLSSIKLVNIKHKE